MYISERYFSKMHTCDQHLPDPVHTLRRRNLKIQQSAAILHLCLRETGAEKSRDYRDVIAFEKLRFQNVIYPHENEKPAFLSSSGLKSVFEKLCSRDELVWTVSPA